MKRTMILLSAALLVAASGCDRNRGRPGSTTDTYHERGGASSTDSNLDNGRWAPTVRTNSSQGTLGPQSGTQRGGSSQSGASNMTTTPSGARSDQPLY